MEIKQLRFLRQLWRLRRHVYLDHNATTRVSRRVRRQMNRVLKSCYGNPSSLYASAKKSREIVEAARQHVAAAINAAAHEVHFTGSATEANNAVLQSLSRHFHPRRNKIISTPIEHPSVVNTLEFLKTQGITVDFCPLDDQGRVLLNELEKRIDDDTFLVCCMLANNEIGTIQDLAAIAALARRRGVLVMSDCVQAFGKIPLDVHGLGIDYASFSAHKLHGPKGVGALYIRQGSPFAPLLHGGHQEGGLRAGTESVHNIAGFGAACQDVGRLLAKAEAIRALKRELIRRLQVIKPDALIHSPQGQDGLPNTLSITFPGIRSAELMAVLDERGIAVSAGSACSAQEEKPSHVLKAIGLSDQAAGETVRISLGSDTSARDIRYAAKIINDFITGRIQSVETIAPAQIDEAALFDPQNYILDVRPQFQRRLSKGLPNSHQASFAAIEKYLPRFPGDGRILVVCQNGHLSYVVAYYLKSKGFRRVGSLQGGVSGWKRRQGDLYQKFAGQNQTVLDPEK